MIAKISITAAFLLMVAPPIAARASSRVDSNPAPMTLQAHQSPLNMVLAQDGQPSVGTTDNDDDDSKDNDNDSSDSADDNQNADSSQTDENAAGENQPMIPPTVLGQPDGEQPEPRQAPQMNSYPQPVNPYQ
jgi:hypothetical protein